MLIPQDINDYRNTSSLGSGSTPKELYDLVDDLIDGSPKSKKSEY